MRKIAIFASGSGSNAKEIIRYADRHPDLSVGLVVCNRPGAGVIDIAKEAGLPVLLIEKERFFRGDAYLPELKKAGIELVVLAGFLWKIPDALIAAYPDRMLNIHPALLPAFGGKGMYGMAVHAAVLSGDQTRSGITIHLVDEQYDHGRVLFQATTAIPPGSSAAQLAAFVQTLEHRHFAPVIAAYLRQLPAGLNPIE